MAEALLQAVYPSKCMACQVFISPGPGKERISERDRKPEVLPGGLSPLGGFYHELAPFLCPACLGEFVSISPPYCDRCGTLFKSREGESRFCGPCLTNPENTPLGKSRSTGVYEKVLAQLIQAFKYHGKIRLAKPFSGLLQRTLLEHWIPGAVDVILPVPLHRKKARKRGFNQSWLLIRPWRTSLPGGWEKVTILPEGLIRSRFTGSQAGLSRRQREENIQNAFEVPDPGLVQSKKVLVVDDVFTTGATLDECARALMKAGAAGVDALTLARAI